MAVNIASQVAFPNNNGGSIVELTGAIPPVDDVFIFSSAGKTWKRVFDAGNSTYRASWLKTTTAPSDLQPLLAIALADSRITEIELDAEININGVINSVKKIKLAKGGKFTGTYTLQNVIIDAPADQLIFDGTPTIAATVTSASGEWYPKWFKAVGDGVTNDTVAIQSVINIANSSVQKRIKFTGSTGKYVINSNISVPEGVVFDFTAGSQIGSTNASTVTFNTMWQAPLSRIFDDNILVKCAFIGATLDPRQWGAVPVSPSAGDQTVQVRRTLAALPDYGGTLELKGIYRFDPTTFVYPYFPSLNWAGKTKIAISGTVYLLAVWKFDTSGVEIVGIGGGYGPLPQFGVEVKGAIMPPETGDTVWITKNSITFKYLQIGVNNTGNGMVYDGAGPPITAPANFITENVVITTNANSTGIPLVIKDAFWLKFTNCVFSSFANSPHCIQITDFDATVSGANPVQIVFEDCIMAGKGAYLGKTSAGGPGLYFITFNRVVQEVGIDHMFTFNSTYNIIDRVIINSCWPADVVTHLSTIHNIGNKTKNITVINDDSRGVISVTGDPIERLDYQGFPGINFPGRVVENPTFHQSKKVGAYDDSISWNLAYNNPAKLARWGSLASSPVNNFNTTLTTGQPDPYGGSSAVLASVITPGSGTGSVRFGLYPTAGFTDGDWIIFGMWAKSAGDYGISSSAFGAIITASLPAGGAWTTGGTNSVCSNYKDIDSRAWQFYSSIGKIQTVGSGFISLVASVRVDAPIYIYNGFIIRVPASENVPVDEALAYAKQCVGLPSSTPVASVALTDNYLLSVTTGLPSIRVGSEFLGGGTAKKTGTLTVAATGFTIPQGVYIKRVLVKPTSDLTAFAMGTTNGGNEIIPPMPVTAGAEYVVFTIEKSYVSASGALWFNGITSNTDYILYYDL